MSLDYKNYIIDYVKRTVQDIRATKDGPFIGNYKNNDSITLTLNQQKNILTSEEWNLLNSFTENILKEIDYYYQASQKSVIVPSYILQYKKDSFNLEEAKTELDKKTENISVLFSSNSSQGALPCESK